MSTRYSYRPLISFVVVAAIAIGLCWAFYGRSESIVRAPGVVYPNTYSELRSPVQLGRVVEVLKKNGDDIKVGETILTLDAENEKLELEVVQRDIASTQEMIKEHAKEHALLIARRKAAVENLRAAEKEAAAAVDTPKGKLEGA